jgi:hypothetical protein
VPTQIFILSYVHTSFKINISPHKNYSRRETKERPPRGGAPQFGNLSTMYEDHCKEFQIRLNFSMYSEHKQNITATLIMSTLISWVVTPADLWTDTDVSEEHTSSIFRTET